LHREKSNLERSRILKRRIVIVEKRKIEAYRVFSWLISPSSSKKTHSYTTSEMEIQDIKKDGIPTKCEI